MLPELQDASKPLLRRRQDCLFSVNKHNNVINATLVSPNLWSGRVRTEEISSLVFFQFWEMEENRLGEFKIWFLDHDKLIEVLESVPKFCLHRRVDLNIVPVLARPVVLGPQGRKHRVFAGSYTWYTGILEESVSSQLAESTSLHEASRMITEALCARLAKGLQTAPENIDASKPLHAYGFDSLMAVEIRSWILINIKSEISLFDLPSGVCISALAARMAASSKLVPQDIE